YKEPLDSFSGADHEKKLRHLTWFDERDPEDPLRARAIELTDGNPRLLEFLDQSLRAAEDPVNLLDEYQVTPDIWKARVIWNDIYRYVDADVLSLLSCALVFQIPLPPSA